MTPCIAVLPSALADQIAAGEVVERPASVVKELLENAIDAGALRVDIEVADGGCSLVRVTDDGTGMSAEDALLSVQRHATSKLRTAEDLFAIRTLGFRGEALPSIASVSRFELRTRLANDTAGTRVRIEGGAMVETGPVGSPKGTTVEVRDLFWNVPARLKFLKSRGTESGHVTNVCTRAALAHHELSLRLLRDGRPALELPRARAILPRVQAAFADEQLLTYEGAFEGARLFAALAAPERARSGATHLHLFVNRRPVRDAALSRAIAYAYGSVLPPGRFPVGALYLELDPSEVDVNVHPQKAEVRFARGRALLEALTRTLAKQLGTSAFSGPAARGERYWTSRLQGGLVAPAPVDAQYAQPQPDPWGLSPAPSAALRVEDQLAARPAQTTAPELVPKLGFFSALRPLAQSQRMFVICEGDSALYVLDQHAADERVRFDRLRRAYTRREVKTQQLLFPERVECTELEATMLEERTAELAAAGLHCSRLGPTTIAVAAVPALLVRAAPRRLLHDVLAELSRSGERSFGDAIDMALATMACHGAIRAGDALGSDEIAALLRSLDEVKDFQRHCPHGRPVVCTLPWDELRQRLGR